MKHQVYFGIAIRIIILFGAGLLMSFASPWLHEFFGDSQRRECEGSIDGCWEWSAAHYWYYWGTLLLFLLSLLNIIVASVSLIQKHYPEMK
jgi:hypothetical protein